MSRPGPGRPFFFTDPDEMQRMIDQYFAECDLSDRPYTVPGLAYALGFACRQSLLNYEGRDEFREIVKRAKLRIEMQRNEGLLTSGNVPGSIFDLKENFGWKDVSERKIEQSVTANTHVTIRDPKQILAELFGGAGDGDPEVSGAE